VKAGPARLPLGHDLGIERSLAVARSFQLQLAKLAFQRLWLFPLRRSGSWQPDGSRARFPWAENERPHESSEQFDAIVKDNTVPDFTRKYYSLLRDSVAAGYANAMIPTLFK